MERLNSVDSRIIFATILCNLNIGLMKCGRVHLGKSVKNKKIFQYCTDPSRQEILLSRALQCHSGRNLTDLS